MQTPSQAASQAEHWDPPQPRRQPNVKWKICSLCVLAEHRIPAAGHLHLSRDKARGILEFLSLGNCQPVFSTRVSQGLTSPPGSHQWLFCWALHLYTRTGRCLHRCSSADHSLLRTGSPGKTATTPTVLQTPGTSRKEVGAQEEWVWVLWTQSKCPISTSYVPQEAGLMTWAALYKREGRLSQMPQVAADNVETATLQTAGSGCWLLSLTFLGSMLNFFLPMATCLFLCMFFL